MKRALVTGANRGIGLAVAGGLVEQGHEVFVGARDLAAGEAAARTIGAKAVLLDVADPACIALAAKDVGAVDVLANNAGIPGSGGVLDDPRESAESMAVMAHGPCLLMHYLTPHMVTQGFGRIVMSPPIGAPSPTTSRAPEPMAWPRRR